VDGRIRQMTEEVGRILRTSGGAGVQDCGRALGYWKADGGMSGDESSPLARALQLGESTHGESVEIECFDGSRKTMLATTMPLRGLDNAIVGAVLLVQDHAECRKIEEDLERRVARLIGAGAGLERGARR